MIAGIFHEGSGLGDQLFRYITVRSLAEKLDYKWGMVGERHFKGADFMNIDYGDTPVVFRDNPHSFTEKNTTVNGIDVRSYDPEINFVLDNTLIDGSFEDDKYWRYNIDNVSEWLKVAPMDVPDTTCAIGFRGGEYAGIPELFLGKDYFLNAIKSIGSNVRYEVHTDDSELARKMFPNYDIVENPRISHSKHANMGFNWRTMRYAKYAIIPNSAFFILPRLLKHHEDPTAVTIAPRYWARHNTRVWARPACYYPEFTYIHESDTR